LPRQIRKYWNKKCGKPASSEIGTLISVLSPLVDATTSVLRSDFGPDTKIRYAMLTMPHFPGIYVEDLVDACEHFGIYAIRPSGFQSGDADDFPVTEVNTAHAGMGLGLCEDPRPGAPCTGVKPPINRTDGPNILNVLFTDRAVAGYVAPMSGAETEYGSIGSGNFSLGLASLPAFRNADEYWESVHNFLNEVLDGYGRGSRLDAAVVHGEHADHPFLRRALDLALEGRKQPTYYIKNPVFAAARGAAEITDRCMRRADVMNYKTCIPHLRPRMQGW
jgi:hypothetical protein